MPPVFHHGIPFAPSPIRQGTNQDVSAIPQPVPASQSIRQQPGLHRGAASPTPVDEFHRKPGWRQLMNLILRLPRGRASTVHTESSPPSPTGNHQELHLHTGIAEAFAQENPAPEASQSSVEENLQSLQVREGEADSIQTNVATVHSDDFQMLSPPSSIDHTS
ncbi:hypothetical protein QQS21_009341, partial [Conoideocrella luteorostrata]